MPSLLLFTASLSHRNNLLGYCRPAETLLVVLFYNVHNFDCDTLGQSFVFWEKKRQTLTWTLCFHTAALLLKSDVLLLKVWNQAVLQMMGDIFMWLKTWKQYHRSSSPEWTLLLGRIWLERLCAASDCICACRDSAKVVVMSPELVLPS